jgi:hypothetical protein
LDLEANKDEDSTGKVSQGETHSFLEGGISLERHSSSEKNSTMYAILCLESSSATSFRYYFVLIRLKWMFCSTGKVGGE